MMDVVMTFGSELVDYHKSIEMGFDYMEDLVDSFGADWDVCVFMEMIFDLMNINYKAYLGPIEETALEWLITNEFIEKIDDEYANHYWLRLW